jgi:hypothetical protein
MQSAGLGVGTPRPCVGIVPIPLSYSIPLNHALRGPLVQLIGIAPGGRNAPRATLSAGNRSTGGKGWCTVHLASGTLLRI